MQALFDYSKDFWFQMGINAWMETVRLRDVLSPLRIPVDVVVISEKTYQDWKDAPGI